MSENRFVCSSQIYISLNWAVEKVRKFMCVIPGSRSRGVKMDKPLGGQRRDRRWDVKVLDGARDECCFASTLKIELLDRSVLFLKIRMSNKNLYFSYDLFRKEIINCKVMKHCMWKLYERKITENFISLKTWCDEKIKIKAIFIIIKMIKKVCQSNAK